MWKKVHSKWNNAKSEMKSGDTESVKDKCEEGDLDTQYLAEALDQEPRLLEFFRAELPDGQGQESNPIDVLDDGGPGDLRRRKERSFVRKERAGSLGACRKKSRMDKEAKVQSAAAVDNACLMLTPAIEGFMASMRPPQQGLKKGPGVDDDHHKRMSEIDFEKAQVLLFRAKADRAVAEANASADLTRLKRKEFAELLEEYERLEKELIDARQGGQSPVVIGMLEQRAKILKRVI